MQLFYRKMMNKVSSLCTWGLQWGYAQHGLFIMWMVKSLEWHPSPAPLHSLGSWFYDFHCMPTPSPPHAWSQALPLFPTMWPLCKSALLCVVGIWPTGDHNTWEVGDSGLHARAKQESSCSLGGSACNGTVTWQSFLASLQPDLATGRC